MLDELVRGLAPRGDEVAGWHDDGGQLAMAVRAGIPQVHHDHRGAAVVVDGVAEPSTLLARYAEGGAGAVLGRAGTDPYAAVLADPARGVLVLCRHGDGPPLYYARHDGAVLVASEPAALLAAGVPARPDPDTTARFRVDGECDVDTRTFLAGVRRLLPGQVLEVGAHGVRPVTHAAGAPATPPPASAGLRLGVRLDGAMTGVALLGLAHADPTPPADAGPSAGPTSGDDPEPLPVYRALLPGAATPAAVTAAGLRDAPVPVRIADVDDLLAGLGEPVPDPDVLAAWVVARRAAGEVDAILDPLGGTALLADTAAPGYLTRVADRVATRFGVALQMPYRHVAGTGAARELLARCRRGLPAEAVPAADPAPADPTLAVLRALRADVYATFLSASFARRPGPDPREVVAGFGDLLAGRRTDAGRFWRAFLLERWLRLIESGAAGRPAEAPPERPSSTTVDGARWLRLPVATRTLRAGDAYADSVAWYVTERVRAACADDRYRRRFGRCWYLVVAARPLAVAQGRVRPLWELRPGWWARRMSGFVRDRSWQGLGNPWTMQTAIDEAGLRRMLFAAAAGAGGRLLHRQGLFDRVAGEPVRQVRGPVERATFPANVAVAAAPTDPAAAAADLLAAVRAGLRDDVATGIAGCAVVGTDRVGGGCQVLACVGDRPADFYAAACADDPLGRLAGTPAAVLLLAPPDTGTGTPRPRRTGSRGARRAAAR
ncbi:class II glutamine amidotransferase domain-containing protein [Actinocatenispora comari]|uniref:Glutamine amidotransferase type-2 domain-containing protein n=1 Tax=Actinocatenispora comari TaxID=2807577 RepID=A0A8J4AL32_9ACTN|nr:hypothetical protein [Actinocatenispora comari]GIL31397.1 hypothetical protein NUM_66510 [Actinocatenispora comari]